MWDCSHIASYKTTTTTVAQFGRHVLAIDFDRLGKHRQAEISFFRALARQRAEGNDVRRLEAVELPVAIEKSARLDQQPKVGIVALELFKVGVLTRELDHITDLLKGQIERLLVQLLQF